METIAYMLKMDFLHHGADDASKQLVAWRPLIIALREHYLPDDDDEVEKAPPKPASSQAAAQKGKKEKRSAKRARLAAK